MCVCVSTEINLIRSKKKKSEERDESIGLRVEEAREGEPLA